MSGAGWAASRDVLPGPVGSLARSAALDPQSNSDTSTFNKLYVLGLYAFILWKYKSVSNKNNMIVIIFLLSDFGKVILVEKSFLQTHKFDEDCKSDGST